MNSKRSPQILSKLKKKEAIKKANFIQIDDNDKIEMIPNESGMFEIGEPTSNVTSMVPTPVVIEVINKEKLKISAIKSPTNPQGSF